MKIKNILPYTPFLSIGWSIYTLMNQRTHLKSRTNVVARSVFSNYAWFPKDELKANKRVNQLRACTAFIPFLGNLIVGGLDLFCYFKSKKNPKNIAPQQMEMSQKSKSFKDSVKESQSIAKTPPPIRLRCNFPRTEQEINYEIGSCKVHEILSPAEKKRIIEVVQPLDKELIDFKVFYHEGTGTLHYHSNQGTTFKNSEEMFQGYRFIYAVLYSENDNLYITLREIYSAYLTESVPICAATIRSDVYRALKKN